MDRNQSRQLRYYYKKKQLQGSTFLEEEASRKRKEYVPTAELSKKKASEKRRKVKGAMRRSRRRKKRLQEQVAANQQDSIGTEADGPTPRKCRRASSHEENKDGPCDSTSPMLVKFNFPSPGISGSVNSQKAKSRKRISHATKKLRKLNAKLKNDLQEKTKTLKKTQKQNQRYREKIETSTLNAAHCESVNSTTKDSYSNATAQNENIDLLHASYVVATYNGCHYIGQITSDENENMDEVTINFMKCTNNKLARFKWPKPKDEIPISKDDIVCQIPEPVLYSKRGNFTAKLPSGLNLGL